MLFCDRLQEFAETLNKVTYVDTLIEYLVYDLIDVLSIGDWNGEYSSISIPNL